MHIKYDLLHFSYLCFPFRPLEGSYRHVYEKCYKELQLSLNLRIQKSHRHLLMFIKLLTWLKLEEWCRLGDQVLLIEQHVVRFPTCMLTDKLTIINSPIRNSHCMILWRLQQRVFLDSRLNSCKWQLEPYPRSAHLYCRKFLMRGDLLKM